MNEQLTGLKTIKLIKNRKQIFYEIGVEETFKHFGFSSSKHFEHSKLKHLFFEENDILLEQPFSKSAKKRPTKREQFEQRKFRLIKWLNHVEQSDAMMTTATEDLVKDNWFRKNEIPFADQSRAIKNWSKIQAAVEKCSNKNDLKEIKSEAEVNNNVNKKVCLNMDDIQKLSQPCNTNEVVENQKVTNQIMLEPNCVASDAILKREASNDHVISDKQSTSCPIVACKWWQNSIDVNELRKSCKENEETSSIGVTNGKTNMDRRCKSDNIEHACLEQGGGEIQAMYDDDFRRNSRCARLNTQKEGSRSMQNIGSVTKLIASEKKKKKLHKTSANDEKNRCQTMNRKDYCDVFQAKSRDGGFDKEKTSTGNTTSNFEQKKGLKCIDNYSYNKLLRCRNCQKKLEFDHCSYSDDDDVFFEEPLSIEKGILLNSKPETIAIRSGFNQLIIYECCCDQCKRKPHHFQVPFQNSKLHSLFQGKDKTIELHKNWKMKKIMKRRFIRNSSKSAGVESINSSKKNGLFSLCFSCFEAGGESSSSGGSDSDADDADVADDDMDFPEHGAGVSVGEDSGGDSGSGSEGGESFDSAELFDGPENAPDGKPGFGDNNSDGPASLGSENSDSLTELRAIRGNKGFKHFGYGDFGDEDDDDDDDDDDIDTDRNTDLWDIISMY